MNKKAKKKRIKESKEEADYLTLDPDLEEIEYDPHIHDSRDGLEQAKQEAQRLRNGWDRLEPPEVG